jgi:hypothetical protein
MRWNRRRHEELEFADEQSHYMRRAKRLELCLVWLFRRAPADVLNDVADCRPEFSDQVFDAVQEALSR